MITLKFSYYNTLTDQETHFLFLAFRFHSENKEISKNIKR